MVPSAGDNDNVVGWPSFEIINAVMIGDSINLLDWMVHQMLECKWDVKAPMILQPYVMALVLCTIENFGGACEINHQVYWPFIKDESYLARESSSMACKIPRPNSLGMFQ